MVTQKDLITQLTETAGLSTPQTMGSSVLHRSAIERKITDRNLLYSGVWGNVHVSFKAYSVGDSPSQKGIGCYLNAVQKTKDDARIVVADPFAAFN